MLYLIFSIILIVLASALARAIVISNRNDESGSRYADRAGATYATTFVFVAMFAVGTSEFALL